MAAAVDTRNTGGPAYAFDPHGRLPAEAAEHLQHLCDIADQLADANFGASRRHQDAQQRARHANMVANDLRESDRRGQVTRTVEIAHDHRRVERDDARIEAAFRAAELAQEELARRARQLSAASDRAAATGALRNNILTWLAALPAETVIGIDDMPAPKLPRNKDTASAITEARAKLEALKAELTATIAAPIAQEEAIAAMRAQLDALAAQGEPDIFALTERGDAIGWPTEPARLSGGGMSVSGSIAGAIPVLAWLLRDDLADRLEELIIQRSDGEAALTAAERASRLTDLRTQILETERVEELLIRQAEDAGSEILRRAAADPRAVLALSADLPAPMKE